jgi:hypothetical protein
MPTNPTSFSITKQRQVPYPDPTSKRFLVPDTSKRAGMRWDSPAPLDGVLLAQAGCYVGKRALDKWRYTINPTRTAVVIGDSVAQGVTGALDTWPERLGRDLGAWMGPRLTALAGFYGLYRCGTVLPGVVNGDREWSACGTWSAVAATSTEDLAPYTATFKCLDANATAIRTVADAAMTSALFTLTSATIAFVAGDVGRLVISPNVPPNTIIVAVASGTSATMSNRATATGSSQALSLMGATLTWVRPLGTYGTRWVPDVAITNTSTTITSPTANFRADDVGRLVLGVTGAPAGGTYIVSVTDNQNAVVADASTATSTVPIMVMDARVVNDCFTTNVSPIITSATAAFTSADVNSKVAGPGFTLGYYIASVQSPTQATLSANAGSTNSGTRLAIATPGAARGTLTLATTAASATVTDVNAAFTQNDVGRHVTGPSIPNNTVISSVTNSTTAVLSNTVPKSATFGALIIGSLSPCVVAAIDGVWVDGMTSNVNWTYSIDGGANWVVVAATSTGGPILQKTRITVANPTTLIIRANTGPGNSPTTKSQTTQCGIFVYSTVPAGVGMQLFNMARDGYMLNDFVHGGIGDSMAFLDNALGGWGGLRPDLVIVNFSNDMRLATANALALWRNNLNRFLARVNVYADVLIINPFEQATNLFGPGDQTMQANYRAVAKDVALNTSLTSWTVTDGVTTSGLATISSASMAFSANDIGRVISDSAGKIPAATTILSVQSATAATMSANATGTTSANTFTITGPKLDTPCALLDLYEAYAAEGVVGYAQANADGLMFDILHQSQVGHNDQGSRVSRMIRLLS